MKTRDILNTVTRILSDWHAYNDHQFGCITAFDPQAGYEVTVNLPDSDTIRIVRTRYELVEDNTVLDTADMGEERALDELARLLGEELGTPYETRRQAASRMLSNVHRLDKE